MFYGVTLLGRNERDVWLMRFGELLDQIEIYKQYNGAAKPKKTATIDDVIPVGM